MPSTKKSTQANFKVGKLNLSKKEILADFKLAHVSRQLSLMGRKEVLNGRAKFGIFGDGKELAQITYARYFQNGDWRSGYYRDQTFLLAIGLFSPEEFFYQLYGEIRPELHTHSAGRNFNNHFASQSLNEDGSWKPIINQPNTTADLSPTGGNIPRLLGLALASKLYRNNKDLYEFKNFSKKGNEVAFGMIGDASTSEGCFFEAMNAAAVLQIPMSVAVWDDGYGISVPREKQTVHDSISEALKGFEKKDGKTGIKIYKANGWDYVQMINTYKEGLDLCRKEHVPVMFHIDELTQPQGHSTSGSHERYKSAARLAWEAEYDPLRQMRLWILSEGIADEVELDKIEKEAEKEVIAAKKKAWKVYFSQIIKERDELIKPTISYLDACDEGTQKKIKKLLKALSDIEYPIRKDIISTAKEIYWLVCNTEGKTDALRDRLRKWLDAYYVENKKSYSDAVYNETSYSTLAVEPTKAIYSEDAPILNGREILKDNFDAIFSRHPLVVAFGEDLGKIGGVNQSMEGLQDKYGEMRIFDTGIRETSIMGEGIGLALRGFRPIAEIQYFDYLLYCIQTLSDDLACLHWRTNGKQSAPIIIRTRGHRLEGIWHAGSPMSMVLGALRGIYCCVPRNMTQAAGMYNTLLEGQDPALMIEPLNAYRLKEKRPDNLHDYKVALGVPEILTQGNDITVVTYGSCVRIAEEAIEKLRSFGIGIELIDVQTLLPFDIHEIVVESIKKTRRVLFFDEDVPGGGTGYMMQKVLEEQKAYQYLTYPPVTLSAREHRPAYGSDGDYFSNPNAENVFEKIYNIFRDVDPLRFPSID